MIKKIYLERLAEKIRPYFYIYTLYETPNSAFIHDKGTEYYSETPIKIAEIQKYDTVAELKKLGYVYVLDEPFKAKDGEIKNHTDISARQHYMATAISQGKFHRVDIEKILREQKKNVFKTAIADIISKAQKQWHSLQNIDHAHN